VLAVGVVLGLGAAALGEVGDSVESPVGMALDGLELASVGATEATVPDGVAVGVGSLLGGLVVATFQGTAKYPATSTIAIMGTTIRRSFCRINFSTSPHNCFR
jgi:hypothetical protein